MNAFLKCFSWLVQVADLPMAGGMSGKKQMIYFVLLSACTIFVPKIESDEDSRTDSNTLDPKDTALHPFTQPQAAVLGVLLWHRVAAVGGQGNHEPGILPLRP